MALKLLLLTCALGLSLTVGCQKRDMNDSTTTGTVDSRKKPTHPDNAVPQLSFAKVVELQNLEPWMKTVDALRDKLSKAIMSHSKGRFDTEKKLIGIVYDGWETPEDSQDQKIAVRFRKEISRITHHAGYMERAVRLMICEARYADKRDSLFKDFVIPNEDLFALRTVGHYTTGVRRDAPTHVQAERWRGALNGTHARIGSADEELTGLKNGKCWNRTTLKMDNCKQPDESACDAKDKTPM